jgi:hypothetical protein
LFGAFEDYHEPLDSAKGQAAASELFLLTVKAIEHSFYES